ncbi:MAG: glycerophosphodiester phosphodiesterase family protein [Sphaerochaeta sp.]|nr:glycerophosphodiester phosphodiesterase family protein [Sphaerochaeta sp.]
MNHSSNSSLRSYMVAACAAIIITISILLLTGCASKSQDGHRVSVVAHRGGAALAPENTLAAFSVALKNDVDQVEMDIHLSRDGSMMVIHDPTLLRLTGKEGFVADFSAEELSRFDVASTFQGGKHYFGAQSMPTLEEVIAFVEENASRPVGYQIEIKVKDDGSRYEGIEQKLIDALKASSILDRTIVISFDFPTLASMRSLDKEIQLGALISKAYLSSRGVTGPEAVAKHMASLDVQYVGIKSDYLSQVLYDQLRSYDLGVGVWTVDDTINMRKFAEMGVDFITTNRPDLLNQVLNRKVQDKASATDTPWYM